MSNTTRELLLITKTARQWHDAFDQQVDAIIETINRVDTLEEVARTTEVLDARFLEAGLAHPGSAIRACVIEPAARLNQHVQAHQQTKSVGPALVIDD